MHPQPFQRNTRQRRVILEELQKLRSHPTVVVLHDIVRRRLPKISLGTVYRNLERLAEAGMVRKLDLHGTEAHFDGDLSPHDHIRCVQCGRVDDVPLVPLELSSTVREDQIGYQILGHRLELLGVCPECRGRAVE